MSSLQARPYVLGQLVRDLAGVVGDEHVSTPRATSPRRPRTGRGCRSSCACATCRCRWPTWSSGPSSTEQVQGIVRIASEYRVPVVPRGGGSGTQGGTFALYGGIAVDLTRMDRIIEVDESSLTVTVQAGIDGSVLEKELNGLGLTLPHYPGSHFFGATIGGSLAARGSGVVSTKYGKAEQLALQVEAVVPPGRRIATLPVPNHADRPGPDADLHRLRGDAGHHHRGHDAAGAAPRGPTFLSYSFPDGRRPASRPRA